jgi:hypothetical protein
MSKKKEKTTKESIPFDFRTIKSFEDACKKENVDPSLLPDLSMIPEEFRNPLMAVYRLFIIFKAINNEWIANYGDSNQYKYYPWFRVLSSGSGFGFSDSNFIYGHTLTLVGARLCTDTSEKALYIAQQFEAEYKDFILLSK